MSGSREDVKWQLQIIFIYYTSYADRNNFRLLKQQNYRRFLIDSESVKHESALVYFDLAFQKINHSAIIFKDFLALIPEIAQLVYKKMNRSQAFKTYIQNNIKPLFSQILEKSEFGQDIHSIISSRGDRQIEETLIKINIVEKIYTECIGSTKHSKDILQIFEDFTLFLKDFEICPQLISKSMSFIVFISLVRDEEQASAFNYPDFVRSLLLIAEVSQRKLSLSEKSSSYKITKLLERIEISSGFERLSKKVVCETATTPSILKSFLSANKTGVTLRQYTEQVQNRGDIFPSSTRHKNCSAQYFSKEKLMQHNYNSVKDTIEHQSESFSKDSREIKQAFEDLCSHGEVANTKTLKSFKLKKLFERTGLLNLVSQSWLDIQTVNLQRSSGSGKIEFPQFLQLLSLAANKIDISFSEICKAILADKNLNDKQMIEQSLYSHAIGEYSESDQHILKGILSSCQKGLQRIYFHYSTDHKLMSFSQFTKCMYDLQIFPSILSKNRLFQIFSALSEVREESEGNLITQQGKNGGSRVKHLDDYLKSQKMIQFSGYLLGIIEIAQQLCDTSLAPPQKLIVLLEKVNESKGYKNINPASLVNEMRRKFGSYYAKSFVKPQKHVQGFDQLLDSLN